MYIHNKKRNLCRWISDGCYFCYKKYYLPTDLNYSAKNHNGKDFSNLRRICRDSKTISEETNFMENYN